MPAFSAGVATLLVCSVVCYGEKCPPVVKKYNPICGSEVEGSVKWFRNTSEMRNYNCVYGRDFHLDTDFVPADSEENGGCIWKKQ